MCVIVLESILTLTHCILNWSSGVHTYSCLNLFFIQSVHEKIQDHQGSDSRHIYIKTSPKKNAGTKANVSIILYDCNGRQTKPVSLYDEFKPGSLDDYKYSQQEYLGKHYLILMGDCFEIIYLYFSCIRNYIILLDFFVPKNL